LFTFRNESGHETGFTAPYVCARLHRVRPLALDEYRFLRAATRAAPKITLPSAPSMQFFGGRQAVDPGVYPDREAMFADLAIAYRDELRELYAAGLRYAQIDEVPLAMLCDPAVRERVRAGGEDPAALVDLYVKALNQSVADLPADLVIGVHLCRGNFKGHFLSEGGYGEVAEKLFGGLRVNHFLLEYDTPRAGDFRPLGLVPADRGVVLGLVSSKSPALESVESLARRIDEAARFIDLDRLAVSPQCGFASTVAGNPVTEADERAKLRRVVEAARAVWKGA